MGAANRGSPLSMAASALTLRPAALADIGAVMAIERSPGFELYVGRSEEAEHRAMFDSPSHAYRLGVGETGAIEAFAILRGLGDVHGNLYLKRVAVARPGQGLGTAFLEPRSRRRVRDDWAPNASISTASPTTPAPKRAYLKLGFTRDGVLRKAYRGRRRDARRPRPDGDPEERVGGAAAKYIMIMFVFSWNGPKLVSCGFGRAWRRVGFAWNPSSEMSVFKGLRGPWAVCLYLSPCPIGCGLKGGSRAPG